MSDPTKFYTLIFTKSSLYMNPRLESSIAKLVNDSFSEVANFNNGVRFEKDEDVSKELGDEGLIAIAFDSDSEKGEGGRDLPVACVSAKTYIPPVGSEAEGDGDNGESDVSLIGFIAIGLAFGWV
jgi:hypothetical protein